MDAATKRYLKEFLPAMALYAITVIATSWALERMGETPLRFFVAILPVIPMVFALLAFLRWLNSLDELQQRIQLNAIAFAAGATGMLTFAWGFLESAGAPCLSWTFIFPLMILFWGLGGVIARRTYA